MTDTPAIIPGAEAVLHINDHAPGVLLLHGFSGSPGEMRYPAEAIIRSGYSVAVPRYPGHGTSLEEMACTSPEQWFTAAREAYLELSRRSPRVVIAGLSMGGIFALKLAHEFKTERVALLSTPVGIDDRRIYLMPLLGLFKKILYQENNHRGVNDPGVRKNHICYWQGIAVRQAWQAFRFMKKTLKLLPEIDSQVLIIQSDNDEVIPKDSAEKLEKALGSENVEIQRVHRSNHAITVDFDRREIADKLIEFLRIQKEDSF